SVAPSMKKVIVFGSAVLPTSGQSVYVGPFALALAIASGSEQFESLTTPFDAVVTVIVAARAGAALMKASSASNARAHGSAPRRRTTIDRRQRPSGPDIDPPPCGERGAWAS